MTISTTQYFNEYTGRLESPNFESSLYYQGKPPGTFQDLIKVQVGILGLTNKDNAKGKRMFVRDC